MEVQAQSMTIIIRTAVVLIRVNTWRKDTTGRMLTMVTKSPSIAVVKEDVFQRIWKGSHTSH